MIRWLVKDQKVCVRCGQPGKCRPVSLPTAEAADLLQDHVASHAKTCQQVASPLLDKLLMTRTHDVEHQCIGIKVAEHLVEVSNLHTGAKNHAPLVQLQLSQN